MSTASDKAYHTSIESAKLDGWSNVYEGGRRQDDFKGRIYGRLPGNHRIWRCFLRPKKKEAIDFGKLILEAHEKSLAARRLVH